MSKKTGGGWGWGQIVRPAGIPTYPPHFAAISGKPVAYRSRPVLSRASGALLAITVIGTFASMDFAEIELGPKMQACSAMERQFVWFYITDEEENATEAARKAGYVDNENGAIRVRAHALMHRDRVLAAIEEVGTKAFRGLLIPAVRATKALLANPKSPDHAKTVLSTLSRLGKSERTGLDVNVSGEVQHNHTDAALNDLRTLISLGVAEEKLVEVFGFSGLSRYRKMLAETDAKAPKQIEGTVNR